MSARHEGINAALHKRLVNHSGDKEKALGSRFQTPFGTQCLNITPSGFAQYHDQVTAYYSVLRTEHSYHMMCLVCSRVVDPEPRPMQVTMPVDLFLTTCVREEA